MFSIKSVEIKKNKKNKKEIIKKIKKNKTIIILFFPSPFSLSHFFAFILCLCAFDFKTVSCSPLPVLSLYGCFYWIFTSSFSLSLLHVVGNSLTDVCWKLENISSFTFLLPVCTFYQQLLLVLQVALSNSGLRNNTLDSVIEILFSSLHRFKIKNIIVIVFHSSLQNILQQSSWARHRFDYSAICSLVTSILKL